LGGYFLIEARDLNEAIQVAARFPRRALGVHRGPPINEMPGPRSHAMGAGASIFFSVGCLNWRLSQPTQFFWSAVDLGYAERLEAVTEHHVLA